MSNISNLNDETLDPIGIVDNLMQQAGHPEPEKWKKLLDMQAISVAGSADQKRFIVNRALRLTLSDAPKAAPFERFCIVDKGDFKTWEKLLRESVIPSIAEFNLPKLTS